MKLEEASSGIGELKRGIPPEKVLDKIEEATVPHVRRDENCSDPTPESMDQKADKIHITPLGDHWEIEAESGKTFAHEEDKCEAVKTAEILAQEQGVQSVILHEGDGTTAEIAAPSVD